MEDRNVTDADRECPQLPEFDEKLSGQRDLKAMKPGEIGKNWKVVKAIESDKGFNTIYVAEHIRKKKLAAVKVERKTEPIKMLQFELFVLLTVEKKNQCKQFCKLFEKGNEKDYNWIAITLCGKNLRTLRKRQPGGKLSVACGLSVSQQCLKGLEELHRLGFIHRNVAPSVFAIGRFTGDNNSDLRNVGTKKFSNLKFILFQIYILDFGFAHQFTNKDGTLKPPSSKPWKYVGSLRHMPRAAFSRVEFSRMEDLEMWFYLSVELVKGCLPWAHLKKPKDVHDYQKLCRNGLHMREMLGGLPPEFVNIMHMVDNISFTDTPNYNEIYGLLTNAILSSGRNEFPYDWEETEINEFKNPPKPSAEHVTK
ncbi:Protein CBG12789 [Caenorhabditis briggsae]|uniref:Protein CBG12789 n=1 Tax=Caenorhabditis briggsae TaxID=6238 RepID=A8XGK5_CAEBR|nr:Protein CBG12789 [Caenorhabditis briggsae]CAP31711.2 Protein CBG12789 [Caenorhabditis briggsae]